MLGKKKKPLRNMPSHAIIPRDHHRVSKTDISANALKVINRLHGHKFEAYLVGGSVRDLLLGQQPKDFDVATDAQPEVVRKLFKNARLIGRRFRLAHILFHREIIEVATFRGSDDSSSQKLNEQGMLIRDNVYGDIASDVFRRDFTINALYYNTLDSTIIDYVGGVKDIEEKTIRIIGKPEIRIKEDPVRMLRAIRFAGKLDFQIENLLAEQIKKQSPFIQHVSNSRLFDEILKLYHSGHALSIQGLLQKYSVFSKLFPLTDETVKNNHYVLPLIKATLENTDKRIKAVKPVTPAFLFSVMLWYPMVEKAKKYESDGMHQLASLEKAMNEVIHQQNSITHIPKRFTQAMKQIWLLQYRFEKRYGKRVYHLYQHPRFRAAYDLLVLRAKAKEITPELADWWTIFQTATDEEKQTMLQAIEPPSAQVKKTKKSKK